MDFILYILFRLAMAVVNLLPPQTGVALIVIFFKILSVLMPRYRRIALWNLELAFPGQRPRQEAIIQESLSSMSRLLMDVCRLRSIDKNWVEAHVEPGCLESLKKVCLLYPNQGMLLVTGHFGSFELLPRIYSLLLRPMNFVVRPFQAKRIGSWWRETRELTGGKEIPRNGAFREMVRLLRAGTDIGVLFDQNVTRNNAVFVPWFGREAATTKAVAFAALATQAPVLVATILYRGNDKYRIDFTQCSLETLYKDEQLSKDEKALKITEIMVSEFEKMILANPHEWLWIHKRWKTTPEGIEENFYQGA